MNTFLKSLVTASVVNLIGNSLGTIVALQHHLAAGLGSVPKSQSVLQDFLGLKGTALSAPLSFMLIQLVLTILLAFRAGPLRRIGIGGLIFFGFFYTLAQVGEPILLRQFSHGGFNFLQSLILLINIFSAAAMLILGVPVWRAKRAVRRTAVKYSGKVPQ
jgi:hypothetical protein